MVKTFWFVIRHYLDELLHVSVQETLQPPIQVVVHPSQPTPQDILQRYRQDSEQVELHVSIQELMQPYLHPIEFLSEALIICGTSAKRIVPRMGNTAFATCLKKSLRFSFLLFFIIFFVSRKSLINRDFPRFLHSFTSTTIYKCQHRNSCNFHRSYTYIHRKYSCKYPNRYTCKSPYTNPYSYSYSPSVLSPQH